MSPTANTDRDELWVSDAAARACFGCERVFGVARRRHHCRRCGGVFCGSCARNALSNADVLSTAVESPGTPSKKDARVCDGCWTAYHERLLGKTDAELTQASQSRLRRFADEGSIVLNDDEKVRVFFADGSCKVFATYATETLAMVARRAGRAIGLTSAVDVVLVASSDTGLEPIDASHCVIDVLNRWRLSKAPKTQLLFPAAKPSIRFDEDDGNDFDLHVQQSRLDSRADVRRWSLAPVREAPCRLVVERAFLQWTGPDRHTSGQVAYNELVRAVCGADAAAVVLVLRGGQRIVFRARDALEARRFRRRIDARRTVSLQVETKEDSEEEDEEEEDVGDALQSVERARQNVDRASVCAARAAARKTISMSAVTGVRHLAEALQALATEASAAAAVAAAAGAAGAAKAVASCALLPGQRGPAPAEAAHAAASVRDAAERRDAWRRALARAGARAESAPTAASVVALHAKACKHVLDHGGSSGQDAVLLEAVPRLRARAADARSRASDAASTDRVDPLLRWAAALPDDEAVRRVVADLSALRAAAAAADVTARATPAEAFKTAKRLVDECPATARKATARACLRALAHSAKKPAPSTAHAAASLKRLAHVRGCSEAWDLDVPPGLAAHVREATAAQVVAFTLSAQTVAGTTRLLAQSLGAVHALEPNDDDQAFVAACALERVAMRCLALRLDRTDAIAKPATKRGLSAFERAAAHAQASVRAPTQAELVASTFTRDAAALDAAARGALEDDSRRRDALHAHDACARLCGGAPEGFVDAFRPCDADAAVAAVFTLAELTDDGLKEEAQTRRSSSIALGLLPALPLEALIPALTAPATPPKPPSNDYASALSSVVKASPPSDANPHLLNAATRGLAAGPNRWGETIV